MIILSNYFDSVFVVQIHRRRIIHGTYIPLVHTYQSPTMAEMSTPKLRLKESNVPHAAHKGLPPRHQLPNSLWYRSVFWLAVQVVSLAGFKSVDEKRSTLLSCNTCLRMTGKKRKVEDIRSYFTKQSVSHLRRIVPPSYRLPLMNAKHCFQLFSHS